MALDPRLADVLLLAIAARRARQRQTQPPPGRRVVLKVVYEDPLGEGPMEGPTYTYFVPETGSAWRAGAC
jgi:hypothetical protein